MPKGHIRLPASIVPWNREANRSSFFLGVGHLLIDFREHAGDPSLWREINARQRSRLGGEVIVDARGPDLHPLGEVLDAERVEPSRLEEFLGSIEDDGPGVR